ncbi:MAG: bifunctional SulP family inorganic anion transporter/carbonic anhydrase [Sciscionella sp.]
MRISSTDGSEREVPGDSLGRPTPRTVLRRTVLRHDVPASFVVFLVAIPLSLSIAAASGAPLMAGLVAAVVGGIIAGALGGSVLQVSGPAAGLTVIVAGMIQQYGWAATTAITCAAGVVQILLGVTKIGRLALSLSPAVVHGMLAGIGLIITTAQLHVILGGDAEGSMVANLADLPTQLLAHHPASVAIGLLTVAILVIWPRIPKLRVVPAPLVAVLAATALAAGFVLDVDRVSLPDHPLDNLVLPAVPGGGVGGIVVAVLTVALVASVESLLSAVAIDKMHSGRRSNLNRELIGQGAANTLSGALGGMPVTGVIVRSSTNVQAGARTRASAILHGVWVAVFVLAAGTVLEMIPMAALAGVLLVTGARLVKLAHIRTLHRHYELLVYLATVAGVALVGLAEGVLVGIAVALVRGLVRLAHTSVTVTGSAGAWQVRVRGALMFLGVGSLVNKLRDIPAGQRVHLELAVDYLDHAAFEAIDDWRSGYVSRGGTVYIDEIHDSWYDDALRGEPGRRRNLDSVLPRWFAPWQHWQDWAEQRQFPDNGAAPLVPRQDRRAPMLIGIREFERRSADLVRPFLSELAANGQQPTQLFITCADSRIVPNMITTSGPGDLFCVRNVANLVPRHGVDSVGDTSVGAAVEYAVDVLGVSNIVVCGHSHCGGMNAMLTNPAGDDSALGSWLRHAEPSLARLHEHAPSVDPVTGEQLAPADQLAVLNVAVQLENLRTFPCVRAAVDAGRLELVGMYFDIGAARAHLVTEWEPFLRANQETVDTPAG